jgi:hypothetical protein
MGAEGPDVDQLAACIAEAHEEAVVADKIDGVLLVRAVSVFDGLVFTIDDGRRMCAMATRDIRTADRALATAEKAGLDPGHGRDGRGSSGAFVQSSGSGSERRVPRGSR